MGDAPIIEFDFCDPWQHADGTWGVQLFVLVGEGDAQRSEPVGCLVPRRPRSIQSLRKALRFSPKSGNKG